MLNVFAIGASAKPTILNPNGQTTTMLTVRSIVANEVAKQLAETNICSLIILSIDLKLIDSQKELSSLILAFGVIKATIVVTSLRPRV